MIRKFELTDLSLLEKLSFVPFNVAKSNGVTKRHIIHFYLEDYRLRPLMGEPLKFFPVLYDAFAVCTPDFSMYIDEPVENWKKAHRWNILYGEYWQTKGIKIVPSLNWADERSFEFCFDGIEPNGIYAISTQGLTNEDLLLRGLEEAIKRLRPIALLVYGTNFLLNVPIPVFYYRTYMDEFRIKNGWPRSRY